MASTPVWAALPRGPIYRVGRGPDPFAPPNWTLAQRSDGTFGGRFDDPRAQQGVPSAQRFRVLYMATTSAGAFGETLAGTRPRLSTLAQASAQPSPTVDPFWRRERRLGSTVLDSSLCLLDVGAAETLGVLRGVLAPLAVQLGMDDVDHSTISGPRRRLTQEIAVWTYQQRDATGQPMYAGVRYLSRLNPAWEGWALFADRLRHRVLRVDRIAVDDPGLYDAARILGPTIA